MVELTEPSVSMFGRRCVIAEVILEAATVAKALRCVDQPLESKQSVR